MKKIRKIVCRGVLFLLTAVLVVGCGVFVGTNSHRHNRGEKKTQNETASGNAGTSVSGSDGAAQDTEKPLKVLNYEEILAPADDGQDFKYASDYEYHKLTKLIKFRDSGEICRTLDFPEINKSEIEKVLRDNPDISESYKQFILTYIDDWDRLYPGSNHAILYQNLKTLKIHEVDQKEINKKTLSTDSRACYIRSENAIYVLDTIDISRESDGYIELTHELTHAARQFDFQDEETGWTYIAGYFDEFALGNYVQEALITDFAYEMQGLGEKSHYYTLLCSYFRIILEAIDYDGADFTNHSVNYLIDKMNEYTGTDQAAVVLAQMEAQATIRFTPYMSVTYRDFTELYTYMVKLYMSMHLDADMTYEEAEEVFQDFYAEIVYHFVDIYSAYGISEDVFLPGFQEALRELGISEESETIN